MNNLSWNDFNRFGGIEIHNLPSDQPLRISIDSRTTQSGDTFLALNGHNFNGHDFILNAIDAGAMGIIAEKDWIERQNIPITISYGTVHNTNQFLRQFSQYILLKYNPVVIGITGTNGKTTVKSLLAAFLSQQESTHASLGNFNNSIGLPISILSMSKNTKYLVLEMGADSPGDIYNLCNIAKPKYGTITNIGIAHLDGLDNQETIAKTKSALFSALPQHGIAFVNKDDKFISQFKTSAKTISYSFEHDSDYHAQMLTFDESGHASFALNNYQFTMPIPGEGFAKSALTAIVMAKELGISDAEISRVLNDFESINGRFEKIEFRGITIYNDAYNANPNSVQNAIDTIKKIKCSGNKFLIFGDMLELGPNSEKYHEDIANLLENSHFFGIFTIGKMAKFTSQFAKNIEVRKHFTDIESLVCTLEKMLAPGDIILLKGSRGMQLEKIINGLKIS